MTQIDHAEARIILATSMTSTAFMAQSLENGSQRARASYG